MGYAASVIAYLQAHDIPAGVALPEGFHLPMFHVVSAPRPFVANEAWGLQEVMKGVLKFTQQFESLPAKPQVVVHPRVDVFPGLVVAVKVGIYAMTHGKVFVVGENGGDIETILVPDATPLEAYVVESIQP